MRSAPRADIRWTAHSPAGELFDLLFRHVIQLAPDICPPVCAQVLTDPSATSSVALLAPCCLGC